jgi:hypothetical protein
MDLSGIIVIVSGLLLFFGGIVWLEIRSRTNRGPARPDSNTPRPALSTAPARRTVYRRGADVSGGPRRPGGVKTMERK